MQTPSTPREVAESYWAAECRRDLEALLSYFHDDAVLLPPSGPALRGHREIATFYVDEIRDYPGLEVTITQEIRDGVDATLEWEAVLTDHAGLRYPFRGVNVVRVRDGKFESVRAYFDPASTEHSALR